MTCIVGVRHKQGVVIGGDSAGVSGLSVTDRKDRKVGIVGPYVLGFTTSFRMGQLLLHSFKPPTPPRRASELYGFMVNSFVDSLRELFKDKGWAQKENEQESGGTFLVGVGNRLFEIESDYQVGESIADFASVGSGSEAALGSLFATPKLAPTERVRLALKAAEAFNAGVRAPFHTVSALK